MKIKNILCLLFGFSSVYLNGMNASNLQGFSIATLLKNNKFPQVDAMGWLRLNNLNINSLEGLDRIPGIEKVIYLVLSNNLLTSISSNDFAGFDNLCKINLNDNQIQTIQPHAFYKLKNVNEILLSNNKIGHIPQDAIVDLPRLSIIYLSRNPIQSKQITKLKLQLGNITIVESKSNL